MDNDKIVVEGQKIVDFFKNDLSTIRTGRASPALIENLMVDYYGTKTPLIQLASINIPESKMIVIQPWDKNIIKEIEKAIQASDLGLNPVNEGQVIRLIIPLMTEERRLELVKIIHQKAESAKMKIRNIREEQIKKQKKQKEGGEIGEDVFYRLQEELQEKVEEFNQKVKELAEEKEKDVMTI
ncbi:MAG: ribosome recycling factor [Patescibacteria group bacterium]